MNSSAAKENSVTSDPFYFLDDADLNWPAMEAAELETPFWEAMRQKRFDKSASSEAVRKLLAAAAAGGMSQRRFEKASGIVRKNATSDDYGQTHDEQPRENFNGTLWYYYMTQGARMTLETFEKYLAYFFSQGWISIEQLRSVLTYSGEKAYSLASVKKMFPVNVPAFYDLERSERC